MGYDGPAPVSSLDIVVPPYIVSNAVLTQLTNVTTRLVQSQLNGYDGVAEILPRALSTRTPRAYTRPQPPNSPSALILAAQRGLPDFVRAAQRGQWERKSTRAWRTVGYSSSATAGSDRRSKMPAPLETTVVRLARHARSDERGTIYGFDALEDQLALADIVVVGVPLDESTRGLVNDGFLFAMADGALLVNIARGAVADTQALVEHASTGRLRLALDVTDPEPLPDGHPLFALPNVLISPHVGGATSAMLPRMARLLNAQIDRLVRDEEPANVVFRT